MLIGRKIIHLESVDSTNNYAANLLKKDGLESGTVILADNQFAGKGQRGAKWLANPGFNLTFSVFLDDVNLSVEKSFQLSMWVAYQLVQFLDKIGIEAKIKWPNDIYVRENKIAGILIENQIKAGKIKSAVIGIGLNINQEEFIGFKGSSIKLETGNFNQPKEVLFSLIQLLNESKVNWNTDESVLKGFYLERLMRYQEMAFYKDEKGLFEAEIIDVREDGKLTLRTQGEVFKNYDIKEIQFVF